MTIENKKKTIESQEDLTKREKELLLLLTKEFLTINQASIRLGISNKRVYAIKKKLEKKGVINRHFEAIEKNQGTFQQNSILHGIRLHGQEFNIKLLYKNKDYRGKVGSIINVDGSIVRLYRDSLEVYGNKSFFGDSVQSVTAESLSYWQGFFTRLENDLRIIIVKSRSQNIKLVNAHYSEINNELARDCRVSADRIRIYAREDGKLWFLIDNSFNLDEAEGLHPETNKPDMERVKSFFNDLRDEPVPLMSDLVKVLNEVMVQNRETASGLNVMVKLLKPKHVEEKGVESFERPDYIG